MSIDLKYDPKSGILYATIGEHISQSEFSDALEKITHSVEYPPDVKVLWDARSARSAQGDDNAVMRFIGIRKIFPDRGNTKIAIVVSSDFSFGMARMYELFSANLPQSIMVFKSIPEAEQWLVNP